MQYEPLDAGEVVQVIDWTSVALAIGAAGAVVLIMTSSWVLGFLLLKKLQTRMTGATGVSGSGTAFTSGIDPAALVAIRGQLVGKLKAEYGPELVDDMRITLDEVDGFLDENGGDIEDLHDTYDDIASARLSS